MADYKTEEDIKVPRFSEENGFYVTKERSKIMSAIRDKNTKPEILFRKALWKAGIRYRLHSKKFPGKPDIVINKFKTVVFIDGEFWHGQNWVKNRDRIKSNRDFWIPKIERNMQRDKQNNEKLLLMGFKVFRFWEQDLKKDLAGRVKEVLDYLQVVRRSTF